MPDVCKTYQFCLWYVSVKHLGFGAWCHRIASLVGLIQHAAAGQFHVSARSQQALCFYAKYTDEQLGNVKDIHQSDCPHCQWFDKSLLTFWNCYLTLIYNYYLMHYSPYFLLLILIVWVYFPAKDTKAGATEGCQTWMSLTLSDTECMSSLDIYVSLKPEAIKILKLCVFLIVIFLLELLHLDFNQVLRHEETVCPVYLPPFHSQYASHGHLLGEWF